MRYNRLEIGKDDVGSVVEPIWSRRHHWFELTSSVPIFRRLYLTIYETLLFIFFVQLKDCYELYLCKNPTRNMHVNLAK